MDTELVENLSNDTFMESYPKRDPLYIVIPLTILYSIIFVTGIVGNVSTCVVIARNRHMHTATNYYLFSLAVSDLLLLITGLPQEMYLNWSRYPYIFGEAFCFFRGLAAETSVNATVLTITAFTIERYVAICHPFLAHTMSKLSRAVKYISAIWMIALAFAIPMALQFGVVYREPDVTQCVIKQVLIVHSFEVSTLLFFIAPMTLITVLYALIGLRLRRSALLTRNSGSFGNNESGRNGTNSCRHHSSQRVLKMLVAVVVAFFICWAPFHVQRLVAMYAPENPAMIHVYSAVTYISGILYYVSTTINPILYHIMSLKFREAFKDTVSKCCWPKRKSRPYLILSRGRIDPESGRSLTDSSAQQSSLNQHQLLRKQNSINVDLTNQQQKQPLRSSPINHQQRTSPISSMDTNSTQLPPICTRCQNQYNNQKNSSSMLILNDSGDISNSSLHDVDRAALEDELTAYMNELARRQLS